MRLGTSFGAAAAAYAEHRPDYAVDAVRWALASAPGGRVLDPGAGTGKLTAGLVESGAELGVEATAVEPDPAMLAELRRALPGIRALPGSAEAIPLPDDSVDAVLSGNAMHWFDMAAAAPEIARVLTRGGVLAGLWNVVDDEVGWVAELARVGGPAAIGPRDAPGGWHLAIADLERSVVAAGFGRAEQHVVAHGQRRTAESLVATLATKAGMLAMPGAEREAASTRIRDFLSRTPEAAGGDFVLPMRTSVLRFTRTWRPIGARITARSPSARPAR